MSTLAKTALADLEHEAASTRRMLERFPEGHDDYTPHVKSGKLADLAAHVAGIPHLGALVMTTPEFDFAKSQLPKEATYSTSAALVGAFDSAWSRLSGMLASSTDETMQETWTLRAGDHVVMSMSRVAILRTLVANHMIHHRAQLSVYYRLLDVPVPGMYGPSADER